ncbi:hypothetical protein K6119_02480 [Paracrocinitomix mangrovi]|uniref:hypothetical protein n=1 Tax=Paracrocinitomix mangrovi TaxID=2862509 RepID=UPI001C8E91BF|nr:hypothetical protein [Paracrocinitomix mangrovi]UKN02387.1 hypothetical protein K6119_02480 [Paracrocinitomix mangrovi]
MPKAITIIFLLVCLQSNSQIKSRSAFVGIKGGTAINFDNYKDISGKISHELKFKPRSIVGIDFTYERNRLMHLFKIQAENNFYTFNSSAYDLDTYSITNNTSNQWYLNYSYSLGFRAFSSFGLFPSIGVDFAHSVYGKTTTEYEANYYVENGVYYDLPQYSKETTKYKSNPRLMMSGGITYRKIFREAFVLSVSVNYRYPLNKTELVNGSNIKLSSLLLEIGFKYRLFYKSGRDMTTPW